MDYRKAYETVKNIHDELTYLRSTSMLLMWDQWTCRPKYGAEYGQKLSGYAAARTAEILKTQQAKEAFDFFANYDTSTIENEAEKSIIKKFIKRYNKSINIPAEKIQKFIELCGKSQQAWLEALQKNDYNIFKPYLKEAFEMNLEICRLSDNTKPPFEVMLQEASEGISLDDMNREFTKLRKGIRQLLDKIEKSEAVIDDSFLNKDFDSNELVKCAKFLAKETGYDLDKGAYGTAPHPFTVMIGPKDCRITVNCANYKFGVFATIHEAGHAMYGYRTNDELVKANLWGGIEGGFHESQSRFYENIIAKSKEYWQHFYPYVQKEFKQFEDVSFQQYYKGINKVQPSLRRIFADEVTYSLHPIIRFELEQELINGTVDFDTLPTAWADKYEQYLGVRPQTDAEGVLQDIHWAAGSFAYFQTYALGNIYGGQILNTMLKQNPDIFKEISKGNFEPLNTWLTDNIHQYGSLYTEGEMLEKVTGERLNADYFIEYLNRKYGEIYNLK